MLWFLEVVDKAGEKLGEGGRGWNLGKEGNGAVVAAFLWRWILLGKEKWRGKMVELESGD